MSYSQLMTSRRNILGLLSLTSLLPFITKATAETREPLDPSQQRATEFEQWDKQVRYPVTESIDTTICCLLGSILSKQSIAFYYYGGSSPRQLRLANIESIFRTNDSPHTYASAYCHLRCENRIFRVDKISLA